MFEINLQRITVYLHHVFSVVEYSAYANGCTEMVFDISQKLNAGE